MSLAAKTGRMAEEERRAHLLAMPEYGRAKYVKHRGETLPVIEFNKAEQDLGVPRQLRTFAGKRFESLEEAESVRNAINRDCVHMPLADAVARYKSDRAKDRRAVDVFRAYVKAAPTWRSPRTRAFLRQRTLDAYTRLFKRAEPFFGEMTIREATEPKELHRLAAWFRLPKPEGRGLKSDQEMRNFFAAFRAAVAWYRVQRTDFREPQWPSMPNAMTAKKTNLENRNRSSYRPTLAETVATIECVPEADRAFFWVLLFSEGRLTETRGLTGWDWERPRMQWRNSAATDNAASSIDPTTKSGVFRTVTLPDFVADLVDRHCQPARFDRDRPLFERETPDGRVGVVGKDWVQGRWRAACKRSGMPWVPPYTAMKKVGITAMLDAGLSLQTILDSAGLKRAETLEFYDLRADERREEGSKFLNDQVTEIRERKK